MKERTGRHLLILLSSLFLLLFLARAAESADAMLGFNQKTQEHDQWCWAGSSQSVLEYYGSVISQCAIANWAFGRSDCCGNTTFSWSHACNYWNYMYGGYVYPANPSGSLQGILTHWGVSSSAMATYLSQATCVSEIDAGRPFVMRFGWTSGGGHFLDGYGYDQDGQYLHYMDPWPGNGYTYSLYSWVRSASNHSWTHTLQITTNLPACAYAFAYPYNNTAHAWRTGASTLQAAYTGASSGDTIYAHARGTIEQVDLNRPISVALTGGCSCSFSSCAELTRISGSLTIRSGTVVIANILIQP